MARTVHLSDSGKLVTPDDQPVDITVDDVTIDEVAITKLGMGVTPVGVRSAYTQTYSTADKTVPNATYAAPTVTAAAHTFPGSGNLFDATAADLLINIRTDSSANVAADVATSVKSLAANLNQAIVDNATTNTAVVALAADVLALKKVITALVDDLQAFGLVA